MPNLSTLPKWPKPGFYWVRFSWGWEPARWDGDEWLRFGIEVGWNKDAFEIGEEIKHV